MAKGFKSHGAYNQHRGDASAFERDTSFVDKATRGGEGKAPNKPHDPGLEYSGGKGSGKPFDLDLKYSGGNDGYKGRD
jgi:hypothetical protein